MGKYLDNPGAAKRLQLALLAAGYDVGPDGADGILGEDTAKAIRAYRRDHGMSDFAVIDNELLRRLGLGPALITEPGTLGNSIALPIIELVFSLATKGKVMSWDQLQQVVRIVIYAAASYFFGQAVADGQQFQAALTGVVDIGAFVWFIIHQRQLAAKA